MNRKATDLEPLHPLLKKCISVLETEVPLTAERSRPRMQLERATVWLGFMALYGAFDLIITLSDISSLV